MACIVYGIPNCSTVKKARDWLEANGVTYQFHDFKKGVPVDRLTAWVAELGSSDKLLNRQGMTWRKLPDERKAQITDDASAIALMIEQPSIIRRPVVEADGKLLVGFKETEYQSL